MLPTLPPSNAPSKSPVTPSLPPALQQSSPSSAPSAPSSTITISSTPSVTHTVTHTVTQTVTGPPEGSVLPSSSKSSGSLRNAAAIATGAGAVVMPVPASSVLTTLFLDCETVVSDRELLWGLHPTGITVGGDENVGCLVGVLVIGGVGLVAGGLASLLCPLG
eukprot:Hpha_TRINITY_DN14133_c0_g1::TRINITY_DN14133_c0_g1_i1::g.10520::m.10520